MSQVRARGWLSEHNGHMVLGWQEPRPGETGPAVPVSGNLEVKARELPAYVVAQGGWVHGGIEVREIKSAAVPADPQVAQFQELQISVLGEERAPQKSLSDAEAERLDGEIARLWASGVILSFSKVPVTDRGHAVVISTRDPSAVEQAIGQYYSPGWLRLVYVSWTAEDLIHAGKAIGDFEPGALLTIGEGIDMNGRRVLRATLQRETPEYVGLINRFPEGMIQTSFWIENFAANDAATTPA